MTGEEMERAIEFLLQNQATLEGSLARTQSQLSDTQTQVAELVQVVRMQADSQGQFNQTLTTAVTALAEAQTKTEMKVDRLADVVGQLVERLADGRGGQSE